MNELWVGETRHGEDREVLYISVIDSVGCKCISIRFNKEIQHLDLTKVVIGLLASWQHDVTISMSKELLTEPMWVMTWQKDLSIRQIVETRCGDESKEQCFDTNVDVSRQPRTEEQT